MKSIIPFLLFEGQAEEAMNYYTTLIHDSEIKSIVRYGKGQGGKEGTVMTAVFRMKNQEVMCTDSTVKNNFNFTPAFSFFATCESEEEIDRLYSELCTGGKVLMEIGNYGFSQKFGWIEDKFGISWQLNLE